MNFQLFSPLEGFPANVAIFRLIIAWNLDLFFGLVIYLTTAAWRRASAELMLFFAFLRGKGFTASIARVVLVHMALKTASITEIYITKIATEFVDSVFSVKIKISYAKIFPAVFATFLLLIIIVIAVIFDGFFLFLNSFDLLFFLGGSAVFCDFFDGRLLDAFLIWILGSHE